MLPVDISDQLSQGFAVSHLSVVDWALAIAIIFKQEGIRDINRVHQEDAGHVVDTHVHEREGLPSQAPTSGHVCINKMDHRQRHPENEGVLPHRVVKPPTVVETE